MSEFQTLWESLPLWIRYFVAADAVLVLGWLLVKKILPPIRERWRLRREIALGQNPLATHVRKSNERIEQLYMSYRVITAPLSYEAEVIGPRIRDLKSSVEEKSKRLLEVLNPPRPCFFNLRTWEPLRKYEEENFAVRKPTRRTPKAIATFLWDGLFWLVWRLIVWMVTILIAWPAAALAFVLRIFYHAIRRPPRGRNRTLRKLRGDLRSLIKSQNELIAKLEYATTPINTEKGRRETPLEFRDRMLTGQEEAAKRRRTEEKQELELQASRDKLENAIRYVNARQQKKSQKAGETSITSGARYLKFEAVEAFCKRSLERMTELEEQGLEHEKLVELVDTLAEGVRIGFEHWAGEVVEVQKFIDEVHEAYQNLQKEYGEFTPPPQMARVLTLFRKEVPELWGDAQWHELQGKLGDIKEMLNNLIDIARQYRVWGDKLKTIMERVEATSEIQRRLKDEFGEDVPASAEWSDAWDRFVEVADPAFDNARWVEFSEALEQIEAPLRKHEYKFSSALERESILATGSSGKKEEDVTRSAGSRFARRRKAKSATDVVEEPTVRVTGTVETEMGTQIPEQYRDAWEGSDKPKGREEEETKHSDNSRSPEGRS